MNRYDKGARLEREIKKSLEARGYRVVRSAGSKGKVDLVAWDGMYVYLIQCKANRLSKTAKARLGRGLTGGYSRSLSRWRVLQPLVLDANWKEQLKMIR